MDYPPTTQQFRDHVRRQMLDEAKRQLGRVERKAGSSHEGARRQVLADAPREEGTRHRPLPRSVNPGKLELVWVNPAMTKTAGRRTSRAALVMIGK